MKLFLASSLDKTLSLLKIVAPEVRKKVLFVANAAEPWAGTDLFWVTNDRKAFEKEGFEVIDVDLRTVSKEDLIKQLASVGAFHICGGGVFYINELIKDRGLNPVIVDAVIKGGVIYTGTSAGSIIVSKKFSCYEPEAEEVPFVKRPEDKEGLGFIDFVVVPHNNNPDYAIPHKELVGRMPENPEALFFIRDNQAVWVDDGKSKLLSI